MRVALDSNLLLYAEALQRTEGDAAKTLQISDMLLVLGRHRVVIPAQVLGEVFAVLIRRGGYSRARAHDAVDRWRLGALSIAASTTSTMGDATALAAAHGLQIWDAIILTAAAEADCSLLLSEDMQDGFVQRGVTVANPFAEPRHPLLISALA